MLSGMTLSRNVDSVPEFLNLVIGTVGLHPRNSLVCIAFGRTRSRSAVRMALPEGNHEAFAVKLAETLQRYPADSNMLILAVTDPANGPERVHSLLATLRRVLPHEGVAILDTVWTDGVTWTTHSGDRGVVTERARTSASAYQPLEGIEPATFDIERIQEAMQGIQRRPPTVRTVHAIEAIMQGRASTLQCALVLKGIEVPSIRDLVLLQFAFGRELGMNVVDEIRSGLFTSQKSTTVALALGERDVVPELSRVRRGIAVCRGLRTGATTHQRAALLTIEGWLHWAVGSSTDGVALIREAIQLQPGYELATLLEAYITHGGMPRWAFREPGEASETPIVNAA